MLNRFIGDEKDAAIFYRDIRDNFGDCTIVDDKVIDISTDEGRERVVQLAKYQWGDWHAAGKAALELVVRKAGKEKRRDAQNRLYWALLGQASKLIADTENIHHSQRTWDLHVREMFLGIEGYTFNGKQKERLLMHKTLPVDEFAEYCEKVLAYFMVDLSLQIKGSWIDEWSAIGNTKR